MMIQPCNFADHHPTTTPTTEVHTAVPLQHSRTTPIIDVRPAGQDPAHRAIFLSNINRIRLPGKLLGITLPHRPQWQNYHS
jgi:hypothetical protein